jgi:drug/metabolite transporter superfamily protein YnfA
VENDTRPDSGIGKEVKSVMKRKEVQPVRVTVCKYVILAICGFALFYFFNQAEEARRGYAAIGGEGFFILLPVLWWIVSTFIKDIKRGRDSRRVNLDKYKK